MEKLKTALITGASGGIGLELAKVFAQNGWNLVLVARTVAKLESIAQTLEGQYKVDVLVVPKDLMQPKAADELYSELGRKGVQVTALVNNAGFATYGPFDELELERELQMIQLNITTLTHLTRLFLPHMKARKQGYILNISSTAAFQPGPLMAVYYASKAYVLSFSEAIAEELRESGIKVSTLCPGPTESGFQERAAMQDSRLVKGRALMSATRVAEAGYQGLINGQRVVVPGWMNGVLAFSARFIPRGIDTRIVKMMQSRTGH
jgi:uncharacterized protein